MHKLWDPPGPTHASSSSILIPTEENLFASEGGIIC